MTMWVLVFLSVAVMSFTLSSRWSLASTNNFKQEAEAYYLALSGFDIAQNYLMNDKNTAIDFIDENGTFYVDREHEALPEKVQLYNGTVEIRITDEQARVNINRTNQNVIRSLLQYSGVESDKEDTLIDCLLDWIDQDDAHHLNGVEDEYYEDFGYRSKNGPLDTVEELLLVKDFSRELLYGSDDYNAMYPLVTTFGDGLYNVNTASRDFMRMLGVSEIDIENVMRYRDRESGGLSSVPSSLSTFGFRTTFSTFLRIEVTAEVKESGVKYIITAITKRVQKGNGYRLDTVFWREDVTYS